MSSKDFSTISRLGEGAFSSVWKVRRLSDGQEYAMKKVKLTSLSEKEKQNALNEVRILASIKHPCVIGYKEAFFEDDPLSLCIVMEHAGGGDILKAINQHQKDNTFFREEDIWRFAVQMVMGLKSLHDKKILHRDIKSANVFLSTDGKTAKLGDLNVSKVAKDDLVYTQTGTPYYASPEIWLDKPYDLKSDIWSLGCVIYEMCALKPPFRANDMPGLYKKIQRGIFDRIPSHYSIDLYNLISVCLQVKPTMRLNCDQLLSHPLVQRNAGNFIQEIAAAPGMDDLNELLETIRIPPNIKALAQRLPKANYSQDSPEKMERGRPANPEAVVKTPRVAIRRPISQNVPYSKNAIHVRESQSRESRISHMLKENQNQNPMPPKESEREYLIRMQKEYIDRARAIKPTDLMKEQQKPTRQLMDLVMQRSPKARLLGVRRVVENGVERPESRVREVKVEEPAISEQRSPKTRLLSGRRVIDNGVERPESRAREVKTEEAVMAEQRSPKTRLLSGRRMVENGMERPESRVREVRVEDQVMTEDSNGGNIRRPKVLEVRASTEESQKAEANMPIIRYRPMSREKKGDEPISSRQEYLLNKYQSREQKPEEKKVVLPKVVSEKDHVLIRRADYLLEKYQSSAKKELAAPAAPEVEKKRPIITPSKVNRREASDIMEKYANILNLKDLNGRVGSISDKEQPVVRKKLEAAQVIRRDNLQTPKKVVQMNNENNSYNGNLIRPQAHIKGASRQLFWG